MFKNWEEHPIYIDDPLKFLQESCPEDSFELLRSCSIDDAKVPPYFIEEYNGCCVNAAACLISSVTADGADFNKILASCKKTAENGYSRLKNGAVDYYTRLGSEAPFLRRCLSMFTAGFSARSSLFVKCRALKEIEAQRPILLNIAFSRQYIDHTVTAYGYEEYRSAKTGRRRLFFKIRDGYCMGVRYLEYRKIYGISATFLKQFTQNSH